MLSAIVLTAAALLAPTGNYIAPIGGGSEPVVCDSSTVPVQTGNAIVCVAPQRVLSASYNYSPVYGYDYPQSLGGWYRGNHNWGGGFGLGLGLGLGGFGHGFGHGFGGGFGHGHDSDCTTDPVTHVRTCTPD